MRGFLKRFEAVPWWVLSGGLHAFVFTILIVHTVDAAKAPGPVAAMQLRLARPSLQVREEAPALPEPVDRGPSTVAPADAPALAERPGSEPEILLQDAELGDYVTEGPGELELAELLPATESAAGLLNIGGPSRRAGVMGPASSLDAARGGPFAGRRPGHHGGGATTQTETAMLAGLRWLARHQHPDGRWAANAFGERCADGPHCPGVGDADNDAGITGLALLAFLGAGYTHLSRDTYVDKPTGRTICVGTVVREGLKWLLANQLPDGRFVGSQFPTYNSSIATAAVSEAYGLTKAAIFKEAAQRGVDYLLLSQNPYYGWRYSKRCGDNDTSNLGFVIMALHSAKMAGLVGVETGFNGARKYLDDVTDGTYGNVGYASRGDAGSVRFPETSAWNIHRSMTGVGVMCRTFIDGAPSHPSIPAGVAMLAADLPEWRDKNVDYYYWYYGTIAQFLGNVDGKYWKTWNDAVVKALVPHQHGEKDGCLDGSWDTDVDRTSFKGAGRVYATALNTLTLEVYYRFPKAFGVRK